MTSFLLAGPAAEPILLAEVKLFLRVDDNTEDGFISTLISAARLHVESSTSRALVTQSWRVVTDCWPADRIIRLPVAPLISLTSITAYDADGNPTILPLAQFQAETKLAPAHIYLPSIAVDGQPVLRAHNGIHVDYVAGYGPDGTSVPADLKQAILALIAHWFEHRDAVIIAGSGTIVPVGFNEIVAGYRSVGL